MLLGTNGDHEWAYHPDGSLPSVTAGGLAYLGDHAGRVLVLDISTGERRAVYGPAGRLVWTSILVDREHRVYFGEQDGHVYGYEPGGRRLFDVELGGPVDSYPALTADGVLLVGGRDGVLTGIA